MRRKYLIFILLLVIIGISISYKMINKPLYGNTHESIIKVIGSLDLYEGKSINLLQMKDYGDNRIVAFLSNNAPSVIVFVRNKKGNYKYQHSETRHSENLSHFVLDHGDDKFELLLLSVKNQYSDIHSFSVKVNEDEYDVVFDTNPNVQWTELKRSNDDSYSFEWFYPNE